ncbi:hypothetical protein GQ43DRAFT_381393 [Delitschia confertaspora ATCC 74209]|uniref:Multicopper oxidase n=1 Tax=Delitschia confertaspora ATCC 74209 TaxID=1513339 RepID=A0A9P4JD60_9PLEO|nr:hypothetical protein GQ43DRAFT_381393 [Delitschia confertaspora ATCC 74209]
MVALALYYAAVASFSASSYTTFHLNATVLTFSVTTETVSACGAGKTVTVTESLYASSTFPTAQTHTAKEGGPYDNPYNSVPLPYHWPGKPSNGEKYAPPKPTPPYPYGGSAVEYYDAPAWIPKGFHKLISSVPTWKQNGGSKWGEIDCPHLPITGLPGGPIYPSPTVKPHYPTYSANSTSSVYPTEHRNSTVISPTGTVSLTIESPTGTSTPVDKDCPAMPDTGITRTYEFHVAYQTIAPDGVTRNGLTVNGQFPGPLVEANWGDWILLKVRNDLTNEGTALHAHGLFQQATPWYDGVPAVAQCPLVPNNGSLDMLFRADRYGTSWWHSHYSAQYSGGAHGPMVIYGPRHQEYDIDIGPILLEDWFHKDYFSLVNDTMNGNFPPSNNNLINGKMQYPCPNTTLPCSPNAGISKFKFKSGKKHLLRLINSGAEATQKFSIDGHKLTVIAQDFVPIEPYTTNVVTLGIAQRSDVIVEAIGKSGDAYWMRSQLGTQRCTLNDGISPNAMAAVYYEDADTNSVPNTTSDVTAAQLAICKNDPLEQTIPLCKIPVETPATIQQIDLTFESNGTNFLWFVNGNSFRGDYNSPVLLKVKDNDFDFKPNWNVFNFGTNSSVRIHLINHGLAGGHPMHLHGHDFSILAEGFGPYNSTNSPITRPSNPSRRDVHILQNALDANTPSYMILQYNQDNPGVWPLHCHLAWHVSGGLFLNALERPGEVGAMDFDRDVAEGCGEWGKWTAAGNTLNQIDSGL